MAKTEKENVSKPKLNEVVIVHTVRPNGTIREQQDFSACPSLAEQHTAHLTDINYLMEKYKPDELAAYIATRNSHRTEIRGHDFSQEPDLQEAHNILYKSKQEFQELPEDVRNQFRNHLEFIKFIDNPQNEEKMIRLGILTKKQIESVKIPEPVTTATTQTPTPTQEKEKEK